MIQIGNRQKGFTLIEVLIATLLVTASLGILLQLFASATTRIHKASNHARIIIAQKQIYQKISAINLYDIQKGQGEIEGMIYQWKAEKKTKYYPVYDGEGVLRNAIARYLIKVMLQQRNGKNRHFQWEQIALEKIPLER